MALVKVADQIHESHSQFPNQWLFSHTLSLLFRTCYLIFCNVDRLRTISSYGFLFLVLTILSSYFSPLTKKLRKVYKRVKRTVHPILTPFTKELRRSKATPSTQCLEIWASKYSVSLYVISNFQKTLEPNSAKLLVTITKNIFPPVFEYVSNFSLRLHQNSL